jgi:DNA-binding response OmpR family regulator
MLQENRPLILIVDDEPLVLELERRTLNSGGFDVAEARNGQEAVDAVSKLQPALVIMDLMMPVMDGFTACQKIRQNTNVPIVFVTALGGHKDLARGLELGADDYVVKPFSPRELIARVKSILRRAEVTH